MSSDFGHCFFYFEQTKSPQAIACGSLRRKIESPFFI
nr:MAG TPA: hypothetical protein [Caudoviricetes sp.]